MMNGSTSFGNAPISGVRWAAERSLARQGALDLGEVGRPVAEREHEAEAEHEADPARADRVRHVAGLVPSSACRPGSPRLLSRIAVHQPVPAADVDEADDHDRQQRRDDHEELQHLVVDRRREAAEADVDHDDHAGDDDADEQRPAEQQLEHERQRVEVHARDQHRGDREGDRVELVRAVVEAQAQVLGDRADLRAVVERHHHQAEEDHGRDGADPVVVDRRDAVLRAVGRHADHLERAEVGRDEGQARDPRRQRAAGQEVVQARLDVALGREPHAEDDEEVRGENRVVDEVGVEPEVVQGGLSGLPPTELRRQTTGWTAAPRPAASRRTRALSVFSHVKSWSSRPKWP